MRIAAVSLIPFLALAACQSCKRTTPGPAPIPAPGLVSSEAGASASQDASVEIPIEVESVPYEAGALDAGPSVPANPCWKGIVGSAHAFCEGETPTMVAVNPRLPDSKKKLYFAMSAATAKTRLVVRYANGSASAKFKTVAVLVNNGTAPGSFVLLKKGVAGPTTNLPEGENLATERWSTSVKKPPVQVAAGKQVKVDPSLEVGLQKDYATMGLYEYSFDQPHTVFVCFVGPTEDSSVCPGLAP